jgi:hypothetical protein
MQIVRPSGTHCEDFEGYEQHYNHLEKTDKFIETLRLITNRETRVYKILSLSWHFQNRDQNDALVVVHDEIKQYLMNDINKALNCKKMKNKTIKIILYPSKKVYDKQQWIEGYEI